MIMKAQEKQAKYSDTQIMNTLAEYKEQIEKRGYNVYAIMLKGSQNYNLDDNSSDIDANVVFLPSLRQLQHQKGKKFVFDDGEVTCHDIYSFAEIVAKGNPQWIEVCHTEYKIGGSLEMFSHFNLNPSALKGMFMEKVHAFSKLYPSRVKYVKEFGYDPKQLHHLIRLYDCLNEGVLVKRYEGAERTYMLDIKRGGTLTLEEASALKELYIDKLEVIYKERKLQYQKHSIDYELLDELVVSGLLQMHNKKETV